MELCYKPVITLLRIYPKKRETLVQKNISTPMFTAVLFTTAKIWKQPRCPSLDEWIKQMWYIYNGILLGHKKEENFTLCNSMDGPGEHYAE